MIILSAQSPISIHIFNDGIFTKDPFYLETLAEQLPLSISENRIELTRPIRIVGEN